MEMTALCFGTERNSMFNFEELMSRTHELEGIKEPSPELLNSDEWLAFVDEIVKDGLNVGRETYSLGEGDWRE